VKIRMHGLSLFILFALMLGFIACTDRKTTTDTVENQEQPANLQKEAVPVQLHASFIKLTDGVNVRVRVTGLEPNSTHGLHIHEVDTCSPPDFMSAGSHFNPDSSTHGGPDEGKSHMGDLGNITADERGIYSGLIKVKNASNEGKYSILNRSLVVHEKSDDFKSQPAGDSGKRLACVVISSIE
jgi:superoxide dismutase, Cu-Zn family